MFAGDKNDGLFLFLRCDCVEGAFSFVSCFGGLPVLSLLVGSFVVTQQ